MTASVSHDAPSTASCAATSVADLNRPFADHAAELARAEAGVRTLVAARRGRWYPRFHIASDGGWLNDPNGLCFFRGRWHVFYQLHPFGTQWGPMHWGHVSSADLVTWRREPIALAPSIEAERAGVFSGSAVAADDGRLYVFYTGHRWHNGRDSSEDNREVQCLAVSEDGVTFEKRGVVVENPDDLRHFRDPKVFRRDGAWYMVFGRSTADRRGEIVLYRSHDLISWEFDRVLFRHPDERVFMLECPDFFPLAAADGTECWVLCFSAMGAPKSGYRVRNANTAGYVLGSWEPGGAFAPETDFEPWDWGPNYYAPQSFAAPDGRRLVLGWMCPATPAPMQGDGWCGQMTLMREVTLGPDGVLRTAPVAEVAALRRESAPLGPVELARDEERVLMEDAGAEDGALEIEFTLDLAESTADRCGLKLHATPDGGYVYVAYDDQTQRVVLDRQAVTQGERGYRAAPVSGRALAEGRLDLRIFVDRGSIEVYVEDGRAVLGAYSYPTDGPRAVRAMAEGGTAVFPRLEVHRLASIGLDAR